MSSLILHHYPLSPYSEKIRSMLAYADIDWRSEITKEMPPRPLMETLAGGYGRIPVAQIGADVFCDSNVIAAEIARMSQKPELDLSNASPEIRAFVEKVEGDIFFACVLASGGAQFLKKLMSSMGLWGVGRFFVDRINMGRKASIKAPGVREAEKIVKQHLQNLESMLSRKFLFSDQPCIADFSAYHSLWFVRDVGEKPYVRDYPKVMAWMDRIKAFSKKSPVEIKAQDAIDAARDSQPRAIDDSANASNDLLHKKVAIAPADYRQVFTTGILQAEQNGRWIIAREHPQVGVVHVHFPMARYALKAG